MQTISMPSRFQTYRKQCSHKEVLGWVSLMESGREIIPSSKSPISRNSMVEENTVLQLNFSETDSEATGSFYDIHIFQIDDY